jgi:anti-anti-sigma factor
MTQPSQGLTIEVSEILRQNQAKLLQEHLCHSLATKMPSSITLDLTRTTDVDMAGIQLLLGLFNTCQERGLTVQIDIASPKLRDLFKTLGLTKRVAIREVSLHG